MKINRIPTKEEYERLSTRIFEILKEQEDFEIANETNYSVGVLTGIWMMANELKQTMEEDGFVFDGDVEGLMDEMQERIHGKALRIMEKNKSKEEEIAL